MARFTMSDLKKFASDYEQGRNVMQDIVVEISPGINNIDPLLLLSTFDGDKKIQSLLPMAAAMISGKQVTFWSGKTNLYSFICTDSVNLGLVFSDAPYLLEALINTAYGIMLKKLTPPSVDLPQQENALPGGAENQVPQA